MQQKPRLVLLSCCISLHMFMPCSRMAQHVARSLAPSLLSARKICITQYGMCIAVNSLAWTLRETGCSGNTTSTGTAGVHAMHNTEGAHSQERNQVAATTSASALPESPRTLPPGPLSAEHRHAAHGMHQLSTLVPLATKGPLSKWPHMAHTVSRHCCRCQTLLPRHTRGLVTTTIVKDCCVTPSCQVCAVKMCIWERPPSICIWGRPAAHMHALR
jgi:hypothetical protein